MALTVAPPVPAAFYVVNGGNSSVRDFALTAQGNAVPLSTLAGADTQLDGTSAVTLNSLGGLYVANADSDTITEYNHGATGDALPAAVLSGPDTGLAAPEAIALDATGELYLADRPAGTITVRGDLYVSNRFDNRITGPGPGADGDATPISTIVRRGTGLGGESEAADRLSAFLDQQERAL